MRRVVLSAWVLGQLAWAAWLVWLPARLDAGPSGAPLQIAAILTYRAAGFV